MNVKPVLQNPESENAWVVVCKHPYYPEVDYFKTEAEAMEYAQVQIESHHSLDGRAADKSCVSVAKVSAHVGILTIY